MISLPGGEPLAGQEPYRALYLHIPFCKSKCLYCDFASDAIEHDDPRIEAYIDEMILAIRAASRADLLGHIETVYIGGGTPTYIGNKQLSRLLYALSLSMHLTPEVECTLEVNPESLTEAMVKDLFALGVTRLSIGVQSFDDDILKLLGRAHDAKVAARAIEIAKVRFDNISIDLMCGLPEQDDRTFLDTLDHAIKAGVSHVSIYPLSIEPETPYERMMNQGMFTESADDLSDKAAQMMLQAQDLLGFFGFYRYEVASYALPGFECRHNKAYWSGKPYLGIGSAAVTMKQNHFERERMCDGEVQDKLDRKQMLVEDLMLAMRMSKGVSLEQALKTESEVPKTIETFKELCIEGFLIERAGRFEPTEKGWLWGNILYGRILELE